MTKEYKVELDVPYGKEPHEATRLKLTIRERGSNFHWDEQYQVSLGLGEGADLMRQLADELRRYRMSMLNHYDNSMDKSVKELEGLFE